MTISKLAVLLVLATTSEVFAQNAVPGGSATPGDVNVLRPVPNGAVVRMTGVRFAYPLIEQWIERYSKVNPGVQVLIEWRGSQDPAEYDILVEAYQQSEEITRQREYVYVARYAILPVANSRSAFAQTHQSRGLTTSTIKQLFFHDIFSDNNRKDRITEAHTTYTRLQKAGAPTVFANYFGYEQKDIKGRGIAGSDDHLLKAVLRDSTGVTYLPVPVIYAGQSGAPVPGLSVLPVDLNGNERISDDERVYDRLPAVLERLAGTTSGKIQNVPIEYLHLSVGRMNSNPEALAFIRWVVEHGLADLKTFGFLPPEESRLNKTTMEEFYSRQNGN